MGLESVLIKALEERLRPYCKTAHEVASKSAKIIIQHCGIAGACGLVPIPGADVAVMLPSQLVMYGRLNTVMGVSLSKDTGKVLGKFMLSQIVGILAYFPLTAVALGLGTAMKFIPGLNLIAGPLLTASSYAAVTYVLGFVYVKALAKASAAGDLSEAALKTAIGDEMADKEKIHSLYKQAREGAKDIKFADYKQQAKDIESESAEP